MVRGVDDVSTRSRVVSYIPSHLVAADMLYLLAAPFPAVADCSGLVSSAASLPVCFSFSHIYFLDQPSNVWIWVALVSTHCCQRTADEASVYSQMFDFVFVFDSFFFDCLGLRLFEGFISLAFFRLRWFLPSLTAVLFVTLFVSLLPFGFARR